MVRFPKYAQLLMSEVFILCHVTITATSLHSLTDFHIQRPIFDSCKTFQTWSNNTNHYIIKHYSAQKAKDSYSRGWSLQNSPAGSWKSYTLEACLGVRSLTLLTTNIGMLALLYSHFETKINWFVTTNIHVDLKRGNLVIHKIKATFGCCVFSWSRFSVTLIEKIKREINVQNLWQ